MPLMRHRTLHISDSYRAIVATVLSFHGESRNLAALDRIFIATCGRHDFSGEGPGERALHWADRLTRLTV